MKRKSPVSTTVDKLQNSETSEWSKKVIAVVIWGWPSSQEDNHQGQFRARCLLPPMSASLSDSDNSVELPSVNNAPRRHQPLLGYLAK